jgi:ABC-type branched-subunit amino acid transport system substrate-binding protein/outer membrane protein assembly factor BamD (BamD/ComL family)
MHSLLAMLIPTIPDVRPFLLRSSGWLPLLGGLILWGTGNLLLGGCRAIPPLAPPTATSPRPVAPENLQATAKQRQAFAAAEALVVRGTDRQALQAFRDFVRQYPASALTDKALLILGNLSAQLGEYQQAEGYYHRLIEYFPSSTHLAEAYLERGVQLYALQDYDRSLASLRQALTIPVSRQQEGKAHYYLGSIARQRQDYPAALAELKAAVEASPDTALGQQAERDLVTIIQNNLTPEELKEWSQRYAETYPGALLLARLAQVHRETGNVMEEMAILQRLLTAFPHAPDVSSARDRLHTLQAVLITDATKIGVLLPLSGEARVAGERTLWGIELALSTLQERHPGLDVSLVVRDSQGTPSGANNALRFLVNEAHVIGVIGPLLSQVAASLIPLIDELAVPVVSPYARDSHFPFLSPYAFRNSITDAMQGRFLAEYARYVLNLSRFAVLYPDEPYGKALRDTFIEHVIQLQGEVVAVTSYPPEATDFRQSIKRIGGIEDDLLHDLLVRLPTALATEAVGKATTREKPPKPYDAIFLPGYSDTVGLIAPELAFYNITGVQLLGGDGWNSPEIIKIGERSVEGGIFVDGFFAEASSPLVAAFVDKFQARYGERPGLLSAQAYDTLMLVVQVLQAGAKTRVQLRDGLLQVRDFPGVSGTTSMDPSGNAEKILYLLTIRNGRIVQLN